MASPGVIPPSLEADFVGLRRMRDDDASGAIKKYVGEDDDPLNWTHTDKPGDLWGDPNTKHQIVKVNNGRVVELRMARSSMTALPAAIGELDALRKLDVSWITDLKSLGWGFGDFARLNNLRSLSFFKCENLVELPDAIGELGTLKILWLNYCESLTVLPATIGELGALDTIHAENCSNLIALPKSMAKLDSLTSLDLSNCDKLTLPPRHLHKVVVNRKGTTPIERIKRLLSNATRFLDEGLSAAKADDDAKADFLEGIIHHAPFAESLEKAVRKDPALADIINAEGRRAIELGHVDCRNAMQKALFFLGRYDIDKTPPLHFSATAAVLSATEYGNSDVKSPPRRALKVMRDPLAVGAELEGRAGLRSNFVVAVVGVYVSTDADPAGRNRVIKAAGSLGVSVEDQEFESLPGFLAKSDRGEVGNDRYEGFKYLVVMELADRSLGTALLHERIASNEWPLVRKIGGDLARALDDLHVNGRIHGDFKPLNIVRVPPDTGEEIAFTSLFSWQLIDLDVSCKKGQSFGRKVPSLGYCPPEMARVLIDALDENGKLLTEKDLGAYKASVAYDLWSFGVVLFHLGAGKSLWHTNQDDIIDTEDLQQLAHWDGEQLKSSLAPLRNEGNKNMLALRDLVVKLLEPDPEKRLGHFDGDDSQMQMVLRHPFLDSKGLDDATLASLDRRIKQSHKLLVTIDSKLDKVIEMLDRQYNMLSDLVDAADNIVPKLICFLPIDAATDRDEKSWWRKMFGSKPEDLFNREVLVFFVDPLSLDIAPTNKKQGFTVQFAREWVVRAKPWLEMGLTTLKVASVAGRLTGFPVPNVAGLVDGWLDDQLELLKTLKDASIDAIAAETKDEKLATKQLKNLSESVTSNVKSVINNAAPVDGPPLTSALREPIKKSLADLDALLKKTEPNWQKKCGLVKARSRDGKTEWVLEDYKVEFEKQTVDFMRKKYGVKEIDPDRTDRTTEKKKALASAEEALGKIRAEERTLSLSSDDTEKFKKTYRDLPVAPLSNRGQQIVGSGGSAANPAGGQHGATIHYAGTCNNSCHCAIA